MKIRKKLPYTRPSIRSERIIETAALACGKCIAGGPIYQSACKSFKKFS